VGEDGWERACVGVSGLISGTAGYIRARQMTARLATKAKVKSFGGDPSGLRPGARSRRCQNFWSVWGQRGLSLGTSQVAHMHTRRIGRCKRLGRCDSASTSTSTSTGTSTSTDSVPPPMGGCGRAGPNQKRCTSQASRGRGEGRHAPSTVRHYADAEARRRLTVLAATHEDEDQSHNLTAPPGCL